MFVICVPLYNRGEHIRLLLDNINQIYERLGKPDEFLRVVISDYHSDDVDLETLEAQYSYPVEVHYLEGNFNAAKAIDHCANQVTDEDDIIVICNADIVIETDNIFAEIEKNTVKNVSFYAPIHCREEKPIIVNSRFNGRYYIPLKDSGAAAFNCICNADYKRVNAYKDSEFLGVRGELWGEEDTHLIRKLTESGLHMIRPTETKLWARKHSREGTKWYSTMGDIYDDKEVHIMLKTHKLHSLRDIAFMLWRENPRRHVIIKTGTQTNIYITYSDDELLSNLRAASAPGQLTAPPTYLHGGQAICLNIIGGECIYYGLTQQANQCILEAAVAYQVRNKNNGDNSATQQPLFNICN